MTRPSSSPARRRRVVKPADERRRDLLDAGLALLKERGYEGAAVSEIADRAGVAKGTFYLYFETKAHLVVALRDRHREQITADIMGSLGDGRTDAWSIIDATLDAFVTFLVEDREAHDVLFDGPAAAVTVPGEDDSVATVAFLIRAGTDSGEFAVDDPLMAASLLFYGVHGAVDEALQRGGAGATTLREMARDVARRILAPSPNVTDVP